MKEIIYIKGLKILLTVFIILISVFIIYFALIQSSKNIGNKLPVNINTENNNPGPFLEEDKNVQATEQTLETIVYDSYGFLQYFFSLLNKKQYKNAYDLLNKEYVDDFGITQDLFKTIYEIGEEIDYEVLETVEQTGKKIYIVRLYRDKEEKKKGFYEEKTFTIFEEQSSYSIADRGILDADTNPEHLKAWTYEGMEISETKKILLTDGAVLIVKIKNITGKDITLPASMKTFSYINNERDIYYHQLINGYPDDYVIPANCFKIYKLYFKEMLDFNGKLIIRKSE